MDPMKRIEELEKQRDFAADVVTRLLVGGHVTMATLHARYVWVPLDEEYDRLSLENEE